jgi:hypothetical protein
LDLLEVFVEADRIFISHAASACCSRRDRGVKLWWHKRSLKLRLALWYALTTALVLGAFVFFIDQLVEHWLRAETDRQLRIDFDMIEPQLETNEIRYLPRGAHGDEGPRAHTDVV